jgi:mRNA-degrading endonuclease RelE of RelBE toxin-antitoxin system
MTTTPFRIELVRDAEKDLKRLRPWTAQVTRQLLQLEQEPTAGHPRSGILHGTRSLEFNLKGSGAYRAVYVILDENRVCVVLIVGPHENIYARAERRYRAWLKRVEIESLRQR